jgi:hypothetical protein
MKTTFIALCFIALVFASKFADIQTRVASLKTLRNGKAITTPKIQHKAPQGKS